MYEIGVETGMGINVSAKIDPEGNLLIVAVTDTPQHICYKAIEEAREQNSVDLTGVEVKTFSAEAEMKKHLQQHNIPAANVVRLIKSSGNGFCSHLTPSDSSDTIDAFWRVAVNISNGRKHSLRNVMQQIVSDYDPQRICEIADEPLRHERQWPWGDSPKKGPWPVLHTNGAHEDDENELDEELLF